MGEAKKDTRNFFRTRNCSLYLLAVETGWWVSMFGGSEGMGMVKVPQSADNQSVVAVRGPRLPRRVAGIVSFFASLWTLVVCLHETPTAVHSFCGTCRGVARASLCGEAAWAVGVSMVAAVVARFVSAIEFRVARSAAVVAAVVWLMCVGFVRGWW